ncbi:MAG: hypothetical protein J6A36_03950 [Clostridia bacterium]|nr:hypothetical protein [Clostridia bacterium]
MLILAGVSINAIVGDNGIITKAQGATYTQSRAALEEYLNQYYVEHYDDLEDTENKAVALKNYSKSASWFYQGAPLGYVIDSDGNSHYFINVNGLPNDIKTSVIGGNANGKSTLAYSDYASLKDVYGVTSDLKVYYCPNGKDSIVGIDKENLDKVDLTKEIFAAGSNMAKAITGNEDSAVTLENLKSVSNLTIDNTSGISSLKDLYALVSLKDLTLDGVTLNNLDGIENALQLTKVQFKSCVINNYNALGKLASQLQTITLYNIDDSELSKFCDKSIGIGSDDFTSLKELAIVGNETWLYSVAKNNSSTLYSTGKSAKTITSIEPLNLLTESTKSSVTNLNLQCNNLTNVKNLENFRNVKYIRLEANQITTLTGLENMQNLDYIMVAANKLGQNENTTQKNIEVDSLYAISNLKKIKFLNARDNQIVWIDYINNGSSYSHLYLDSNAKFNVTSVTEIADIYASISQKPYKSIDSSYTKYLNTTEIIKYESYGLTDTSDEIKYLEGLVSNGKASQVKCLSLYNNPSLSNNKLQTLLPNFTGLVSLDLGKCSNLSSLNFVSNMKNSISFIAIDGTAITGTEVSKLEDCINIKGIVVNNVSIDLTKMQKTISRCTTTSSKYVTRGFNYFSLYIWNADLMKQLEECTEVTKLQHMSCSIPTVLNLSKLTKLNFWQSNSGMSNCDLTLPVNIKNIYDFGSPKTYSFVSGVSLTHYEIHGGTEILKTVKKLRDGVVKASGTCSELALRMNGQDLKFNLFENLSGISIKNISITHYNDGQYYSITDFQNISNCPELEKFEIYYCKSIGKSLKNIGNCTNLKYLIIPSSDISDLGDLDNCTNLYSVNLSDNKLTGIYQLSNMKKLKYLNLSNNCLYDSSVYIDADNKAIEYNNLSLLSKLNYSNQGFSLTQLYLQGNSGITDYSSVSDLSWPDGKSGF